MPTSYEARTRVQSDPAQPRKLPQSDPPLADDNAGIGIYDRQLASVLKQHLEASPHAVTTLTLAIRQVAWWHGSDQRHKPPRASGWRDPQGRHYVYMKADDWRRTFPSFGTQTHRRLLVQGRKAGLLHTIESLYELRIRVDFTKLRQLYLASGQDSLPDWLTEPPPAEGTQLSADVELDFLQAGRGCGKPQADRGCEIAQPPPPLSDSGCRKRQPPLTCSDSGSGKRQPLALPREPMPPPPAEPPQKREGAQDGGGNQDSGRDGGGEEPVEAGKQEWSPTGFVTERLREERQERIEEAAEAGHLGRWEENGWHSKTPCPACRGHMRGEDRSECLSCGQMLEPDVPWSEPRQTAILNEIVLVLRELSPEDPDTSRIEDVASTYLAAGVRLDPDTIRRLGEKKNSPIGFVLTALRDEMDKAGGDQKRAWAAIEARTRGREQKATGGKANGYHKEIGRYY